MSKQELGYGPDDQTQAASAQELENYLKLEKALITPLQEEYGEEFNQAKTFVNRACREEMIEQIFNPSLKDLQNPPKFFNPKNSDPHSRLIQHTTTVIHLAALLDLSGNKDLVSIILLYLFPKLQLIPGRILLIL